RLLVLETVAKSPEPGIYWDQVADQLREVPGVEKLTLAGWPLLSGMNWNRFISINGGPPNPQVAYFLNVSANWADTMKIPFQDGRDFTVTDVAPNVAIVNQTFAKTYFNGENPIGRFFGRPPLPGQVEIVGLISDALYRNVHEQPLPIAYFPFHTVDDQGVAKPTTDGTFLVRTSSANPLALSSNLRREISRMHPEFRVSNIRTQTEINQAQ